MSDSRASIPEGAAVGTVLAGKYRIERILGAGGMGVVAAAHHLQLDERVAIKFLLPDALQNAEAVARFAREARAAVKIKSEHVARIIDVGTLETGSPYMVMEFLEGTDLSDWIRRRGVLPIDLAVEFVLQASEAIAEAHGLGIIHRDLKPANLFVIRRADGTESVKVLDFGISKVTNPGNSGDDMGMTKTQTMMGSPLYMSPEQMASSRDVDGRTDIWAIGVTLYELVTGGPPFQADSIPQLCTMILQQPPPQLRKYRPDAPEGLERAVNRCLAKDRNLRYTNVGELANDLVPFAPQHARVSAERIGRVLAARGITSSAITGHQPIASVEAASALTGQGTVRGWAQTSPGARRRTTFAVAGVAAVVAIAAAAGIFVFRNASEGAAAASVQPDRAPIALEAEMDLPTPAVQPLTAPDPAAPAASSAAIVEPAPAAEPAPSASAAASVAPAVRPRAQTATKNAKASTAAQPTPSKTTRLEDLYGDRK
jgi:serine/threonine-protein kinase